jgi:hypothetical protein
VVEQEHLCHLVSYRERVLHDSRLIQISGSFAPALARVTAPGSGRGPGA